MARPPLSNSAPASETVGSAGWAMVGLEVLLGNKMGSHSACFKETVRVAEIVICDLKAMYKREFILLLLLLGGSDGKESAWNVGDLGKIPWRRKWQPTPIFLPGEFHGQRSLAGYSPLGRKLLNVTK